MVQEENVEFRNRQIQMTLSLFRAAAPAAGLLIALTARALSSTEAPSVGARREVSDGKFDRQFHFSMLPGVAAIGGKWGDWLNGREACPNP